MNDKIIFGIENDGLSIHVYLGYKDVWEGTKNAYGSQIFLDQLGWYGCGLKAEIPLDKINIPGGFIEDVIALGYEILLEDSPIDTQYVMNVFEKSGFEYSPEFEKAIIKDWEDYNEIENTLNLIPQNLEEKYIKAVRIARDLHYGHKGKVSSSKMFPIKISENLQKSMTPLEKEYYGESPNFEFYYKSGIIYFIPNGITGGVLYQFEDGLQRALLDEIIKEYGK